MRRAALPRRARPAARVRRPGRVPPAAGAPGPLLAVLPPEAALDGGPPGEPGQPRVPAVRAARGGLLLERPGVHVRRARRPVHRRPPQQGRPRHDGGPRRRYCRSSPMTRP